MKRMFLGVAGLSALLVAAPAISAKAADMELKAPVPVVSWTGCYIDGGVGYGMGNLDHSSDGAGFSTVTTTDGSRGWLGRAGAGCDYQVSPRWVIGVLGDYDFMNLTGSNSPSEIFPPVGGGISPVSANITETGAWYVGARIGYLVTPSFLTFVDGGYTQTSFNQSSEFHTSTGVPIAFSYPNFTSSGWFIGSGVEYALNMDWLPIHGLFVRTEYRFAQYQNTDLAEFSTTTGLADGNIEHMKPYVQTVTTSLVWRFNTWMPR